MSRGKQSQQRRSTVTEKGQQALERAKDLSLPSDVGEVGADDPPQEELSLDQLVEQLNTLHRKYLRATDDLSRDRKRLDEREAEVEKRQSLHETAIASLSSREEELRERERSMADRELDAETGFAKRERDYWDRLREETNTLRDELRLAVQEVERADIAGIGDRIADFHKLRTDLEASFAARESELLQREGEVEETLRSVTLDRRRTEVSARQLEWDREEFESEKSAALALERARHAADRQTWEAERAALEAALADVAQRKAELDERERRGRYIDPLRLEQEKDELISRLRAAHEELSHRLPQVEVDELKSRLHVLEQQATELEAQRERAGRLEAQLEATRSKLESLRLVDLRNENLTAEKAALEADVDELRRTLVELSDRRSQLRPFQQCSGMDDDAELQAGRDLWSLEGGLEELVALVRDVIAFDGLYYDDATLRSFIAGMHSSHLHILQGISGTGKSSLPQAVARAMGVDCRTVEVQAAWRDRQDLLGYFNPFEHRYEETPFLAALYLAGTPRHAGSPFFILLDEMNLSHPEQYLADVFSAMERPERERTLRLMNHSNDLAPRQLLDGMSLRLPQNAWIVGTANHDETTVSFAPKTYDRSHVLELPTRHPSPWDGAARPDAGPISLRELQQLFSNAVRQNRHGASTCALDFLDGLRPGLAKMGVGWGNRIERQLRDYAPVVTGGGGSVKEAVDVFVSLKVVKKLEGRYEFTASQVEELADDVAFGWDQLPGAEPEPHRINEILTREVDRLR